MRYFIEIAFDGSQYHGWQVQPNAISVQEVLNKSIALLARQEVSCVGCGRTDAGVHATQFFVHFGLNEDLEDSSNFIFKLNNVLPKDIAVKRIIPVSYQDHARFSATERSYEYHMHAVKDPFLEGKSKFYIYDLDIDKMNAAGEILLQHQDFASFCKTGTDVKTTICDLREARWEQKGHRLVFHITADRFLRNMVRGIVGTMIDIGRGKTSLHDLEEILKKKDRSAAGSSVSGHGLFLTRVKYPFL